MWIIVLVIPESHIQTCTCYMWVVLPCNLHFLMSYLHLHSNAGIVMQTQAVLSLSSKTENSGFQCMSMSLITCSSWLRYLTKLSRYIFVWCMLAYSSFPFSPLLSTFQCPVRSIVFNLTCHFITIQHSLDLQHHQCSFHEYGVAVHSTQGDAFLHLCTMTICCLNSHQDTVWYP